VYDISVTLSGNAILAVGFGVANSGNATFRNCSVAKINATNTKVGATCVVTGFWVSGSSLARFYNCAAHDLEGTSNADYTYVYGIRGDTFLTLIAVNNVIGTLAASGTFLTTQGVSHDGSGGTTIWYNATMDTSGGTNSQDNITPADEFVDASDPPDLHMLAGGQCEDNGLNITAYPYAPTEDCDGETRPTTGAWSIGIDHPSAVIVAGPYRVEAGRIYSAGAAAGRVFMPGPAAGNVYLTGAERGKVRA
jgi:hypothetical protein